MKNKSTCFFLLIAFFLGFAVSAVAQNEKKVPPQQNKWVFGGDFGLGFSNYGSNILVSPTDWL
jgi:hypothetical protein